MDIFFEKVFPKDFHDALLWMNELSPSRKDGRGLYQRRSVKRIMPCLQYDGSAMVQWGDTIVLVGIKSKIAEPRPLYPNVGYITINENDIPFSIPILMHTLLQKHSIIFLDNSPLCIIPKELVWHLDISVKILHDDGNVQSAVILAVLDGLANVSLPAVIFDKEQGTVTIDPMHPKISLACYIPSLIPLAFRIFSHNNSFHFIVDLTKNESDAIMGTDVLIILQGNDIKYISIGSSDPSIAISSLLTKENIERIFTESNQDIQDLLCSSIQVIQNQISGSSVSMF